MNIGGLENTFQYSYPSASDVIATQSATKLKSGSEAIKKQDARLEQNNLTKEKEKADKLALVEKKKEKAAEQLRQKLDDTYQQLTEDAKEYTNAWQEKQKSTIVVGDASKKEEQTIYERSQEQATAIVHPDVVEKMANNLDVATQYEAVVKTGVDSLKETKDSIDEDVLHVQNMGMKIDEKGQASYSAIVDDSVSYYEKEIEKQEEKKKIAAEEKKKEEKAEKEKEENTEKLEKQEEAHKEMMEKQLDSQYAMITAGTIEELKAKLHQTEDKVLQLKQQVIPMGLGIDVTA